MGKIVDQPLSIGGMYNVGDPALTPSGSSLAVNNMLTRPGRFPARPPFTYDGLMSINGLANFIDNTNKVTRLLAIDSAAKLYEKATGSEAWSASLGTVTGTRLTDYCNYLGKIYMMLDNGSGLPTAAVSFDGTNISSSPFTSAIQARTVTAFNERLFLAYPRVTVSPLMSAPLVSGYDWTNSAQWHPNNVTVTMQTLQATPNAIQQCYVYPTSLAANACSLSGYLTAGLYAGLISGVAASAIPAPYVWRFEALGTDSVNDMPITIEMLLALSNLNGVTYNVGDMVAPNTGFAYRCTVGGVSAGGALGTTINATTVDGGVTWMCVSTDIMGSSGDQYIPSIAKATDFTAFYVTAVVPARTNIVTLVPRLKLYNSTTTSVPSLSPIIISRKDGLPDGDPRKANHGSQWTAGAYFYPFFNAENTAVQTVDQNSIMWSEARDPKNIRAANFYQPNEFDGYPTAAITNSNRLLVFYRNGFIQFQGTSDPDIPIRRERISVTTGCIGSRALDNFEGDATFQSGSDITYFIGENDVYSYASGTLAPKSITGDGMREVVMAKGTGWVEDSTLEAAGVPLLAIDRTQYIIWIHTQKGKLFAYDMRTKGWSTHYVSNNARINGLSWNRKTGKMYISFAAYGLVRMDYTARSGADVVAANDTIDNTANTYAVDRTIVLAPVEAPDGNREDMSLKQATFFYRSDAGAGMQTLVNLGISFDQGATYPAGHNVSCTPSQVSTNGNYLPLWIPGQELTSSTLTLRLSSSGYGGETAWSLSPRVVARLNLNGPERHLTNPTAGSVT
jgi:hypothetical protein